MVCLGNICRSPLAEGVMRHQVGKLGLDWEVDSAGTAGWHSGEAPDRRSIAVAKKHGIDIGGLRARAFRREDFDRFDWIFVMDKDNYSDVVRLARNAEERGKVVLMMDAVHPGGEEIVPDPYYDGRFELVYELLDRGCGAVIQGLIGLK